ncbi:MAG: hypothetical protein L0Y43_04860 [Methylococcaceae bacterium]|nr:hypothetical protein [Methylococcaceae bacterium]
MKRVLSALTLLLITANCSGIREPGTAGLNPFDYCRQQGLTEVTEDYNRCIADYIEEKCTAEGTEPGTEDYRQCEANLRNAAFVRDQLNIRGGF